MSYKSFNLRSFCFCPGPGGGMSSIKWKPPRCENCQSWEKHRIMSQLYLQLNEFIDYFNLSALQISKDFSLVLAWFKSCKLSIYGISNSIDI